jgi:predicted nucleotidyltransferase
MNNFIQEEIKKITKEIVKNYKPEKIILFGSATQGKFDQNSDLDFFIIKDTKKRWVDRLTEVYGYIRNRSLPVDIIVYTPQQTQNRLEIGDPFVKEIMNKGKILYEK